MGDDTRTKSFVVPPSEAPPAKAAARRKQHLYAADTEGAEVVDDESRLLDELMEETENLRTVTQTAAPAARGKGYGGELSLLVYVRRGVEGRWAVV